MRSFRLLVSTLSVCLPWLSAESEGIATWQETTKQTGSPNLEHFSLLNLNHDAPPTLPADQEGRDLWRDKHTSGGQNNPHHIEDQQTNKSQHPKLDQRTSTHQIEIIASVQMEPTSGKLPFQFRDEARTKPPPNERQSSPYLPAEN